MNSLNLRRFAFAVVVTAFAGSNHVRADLLSVADASALIQSTASDTDAMFLSLFAGYQNGQTLNYSSTSTESSWSGSLSGTYLGSSLGLSYSGDLSNYSSGAVTWTSAGTYGAESWSGTGSASITDTSATTFSLSFADSVSLGAQTASIAYTIPGTDTGGNIMFGDPGNQEVGTGTLTLNGGVAANALYYSYAKIGGAYILSDINGVPFPIPVPLPFPPYVYYIYYVNKYTDDIPANGTLTGTITSVPEPSSVLLLGLGIFGGAVVAAGHRKCVFSKRVGA